MKNGTLLFTIPGVGRYWYTSVLQDVGFIEHGRQWPGRCIASLDPRRNTRDHAMLRALRHQETMIRIRVEE